MRGPAWEATIRLLAFLEGTFAVWMIVFAPRPWKRVWAIAWVFSLAVKLFLVIAWWGWP